MYDEGHKTKCGCRKCYRKHRMMFGVIILLLLVIIIMLMKNNKMF